MTSRGFLKILGRAVPVRKTPKAPADEAVDASTVLQAQAGGKTHKAVRFAPV
jgi:hypothetical protein